MKFLLLIFLLILSLSSVEAGPKKRKVKIKVYDKISFIQHALMLKATSRGSTVKFEWSEPHSDFKYFLEIYRLNKKIGTIPVQGRTKTLKFKNEKKKLYWRVFARSRHGNTTPNKKRFLVPLKS